MDLSLLTAQQLADELSISQRTLEAARARGTGPHYLKVGRLIRYRRADVIAWLESQRRRSTSDGER